MVRRGGVEGGKPLVLLHGGMRTSALLAGQAAAMAAQRPVLAMDIAGNGDSDPLAEVDAGLEAYADDVRAVLDASGVDDFDLYGESAGATLALELARQSGSRAGKLILDRPELPEADLRQDFIARGAPAIEAKWDGTHFLTAWHMLRDAALFWPWYRCTADGVRDIEPEVEPVALQARLLAWLKGRLTYGGYVRAAMGVDPAPLLGSVKHPALIFAAAGDLLEPYAREATAALASAKLVVNDQAHAPQSVMAAFLEN